MQMYTEFRNKARSIFKDVSNFEQIHLSDDKKEISLVIDGKAVVLKYDNEKSCDQDWRRLRKHMRKAYGGAQKFDEEEETPAAPAAVTEPAK